MKGLKIDRDDMVDTDGVEYENYSATFNGEVDIKRYWNDIQIIEEITS